MSKIIPFLQKLSKNNNREWFNDNKESYKEAFENFKILVSKLILSMSLLDENIADLTPQKAVFRIYRDVRFSKNKLPYKTHFGAYLTKKGQKNKYAGYYLHVEPNNSFLSGGLYHPTINSLNRIREQIDYNATELRSIIEHPDFKHYYKILQGEKLKTSPRNYSPENPNIDLLRYKEYVALIQFNEQKIDNPDFISFCSTRLILLKPLNDYLNNAIDFIDHEPHISF